jgi:hypothetical protein
MITIGERAWGRELPDLRHPIRHPSNVANCPRVSQRALVAEAFPQLHADLKARGFSLMILSMSEFQKIDGGLSCLSLRFKAPARSIPDPCSLTPVL